MGHSAIYNKRTLSNYIIKGHSAIYIKGTLSNKTHKTSEYVDDA